MRTIVIATVLLLAGVSVADAAPPCFGSDDFSICPNSLAPGYHNTKITVGETTIMQGTSPSGASWIMIITPEGTASFHHYPNQSIGGLDVIDVDRNGSTQIHSIDNASGKVD